MRLYGTDADLVRKILTGPAVIELDDGHNLRVRSFIDGRWITVVVALETFGSEVDDYVITLWEEEEE